MAETRLVSAMNGAPLGGVRKGARSASGFGFRLDTLSF
jgi:hypothetical protein